MPAIFLLFQVLDCYTDIMRNKQLYLEDKSKIKDVLDGLLHCLFSFPYDKENSEIQKKVYFLLVLFSISSIYPVG